MRIGVIGCGVIASAAVQGIAGDGHRITVSERSARQASMLAARYDEVTMAGNQAVIDASDVIFLGLMAKDAPGILDRLDFRADQRVISFMAGASLEDVEDMVRPARAAAVMIPFPGIAGGGSPVLVLGDVKLVEELFGARNSIYPLKDERELAAYLCAQAVLSPVARMVGDAADWLSTRVDDGDTGETFLRMLISTSLSESDTAGLIEALNTPGGYNQRLRTHMEETGFGTALKAGLDGLEQA